MSEIAPDTIIDARYKVLSRIGAGGMAEVFCAHDESLGRKVALKLLHPQFASDAEFVERFRREASSAASLQHPNVVGIYDRGRWDGTYYIAMEYVPGRTLKEVVRQDGPLDPLRAIGLVEQVLKAARFAHRRGIVHRDLKPHNVIVDDEDRAKVTDFGIARSGPSDMTETGSILGTAQYLSPEQAQGEEVSPRSDLYSIGVILFELLTGQVPFDADSPVSIALKHVSEPPPAPSAFHPSVPAELDAIVLWALEKDPARRPPDPDAFLAALAEVRGQLGAAAGGQRTAAFAAALATPADAETPAVGRRRRPPWWAWAVVLLVLAGAVVGAVLLTRPAEVTVPRLVGLQAQAAERRLEAAGLDARTVWVHSRRDVGIVVEQDPRADARVERGSTVTLRVSRGPGTVDVPAVDGETVERASAILRNAGLKVGRTIERHDDDVDEGLVIRTSPPAGRNVARGARVNLYVSRGPEPVVVPTVVGLTRGEGEAALEAAGLGVEVVESESAEADPDEILAQDPEPETRVEPGTTVTIVVATAPPVEVPSLTGQAGEDAEATLVDLGLEPRVSLRVVDDPAQDGVVIAQRPEAGTSVEPGAPVRIFVGSYVGPPPDDDEGGAGERGGGSVRDRGTFGRAPGRGGAFRRDD